jgi:hypothetical protein
MHGRTNGNNILAAPAGVAQKGRACDLSLIQVAKRKGFNMHIKVLPSCLRPSCRSMRPTRKSMPSCGCQSVMVRISSHAWDVTRVLRACKVMISIHKAYFGRGWVGVRSGDVNRILGLGNGILDGKPAGAPCLAVHSHPRAAPGRI